MSTSTLDLTVLDAALDDAPACEMRACSAEATVRMVWYCDCARLACDACVARWATYLRDLLKGLVVWRCAACGHVCGFPKAMADLVRVVPL